VHQRAALIDNDVFKERFRIVFGHLGPDRYHLFPIHQPFGAEQAVGALIALASFSTSCTASLRPSSLARSRGESEFLAEGKRLRAALRAIDSECGREHSFWGPSMESIEHGNF